MPFDGICTFTLMKELTRDLVDGRIDNIYQPEREEIVINVRARGKMQHLLLSADPSHARFQITEKKPETPLTPPAFCMAFRKHFSGNKITGVIQHHFDRILEIETEGLNAMGDLVKKSIILEIMGKHSNLMLVDENRRILDCIRRVNPFMSSVRVVQPGITYELPSHNHKADPLDLMPEGTLSFDVLMKAQPGGIEKALYQVFNGLSPFASREILFRCGKYLPEGEEISGNELYEEITPEKKEALRCALADLLTEVRGDDLTFCLYRDLNGKAIDFSTVPYLSMGGAETETYESLSLLLDVFYQKADTVDKMRQKSQDLRHLVTTNLDRARKKLHLQNKQMDDTKDREKDRLMGDLITANVYQLKKGMIKAELPNYYEDDMPMVEVRLDENLTPAQNAQKYYARYNKQKRTEEALTEQIMKTEEEVEYLDSILASIALCDCERDVEDIRLELHEAGYLKKTQGKKKNLARSKPLEFTTSEGVRGMIGKNNIQNDQLTFKTAANQDEWFHVKDIPGSHVILFTGSLVMGRDYTEKSFEEAAIQAAIHSSGAGKGSTIGVDHTHRIFVKKPAGSPPGFVRYTHQETIFIKPELTEKKP